MRKLLFIATIAIIASSSLTAQKKSPLKTESDSVSYAIGVSMFESADQFPMDLDYKMLVKGILAASEEKAFLTTEDARTILSEAVLSIQEKEKEEASKEAKEFFIKNKEKEGVIETESGLQYKVVKKGDGPIPTAESKVEVHYKGYLIDGTVFDSSIDRGETATFGVTQVISGWTEVLQLMPVGSEYQVFIPSDLAYGDRGAGDQIKPGATLIFDIQLIDIVE